MGITVNVLVMFVCKTVFSQPVLFEGGALFANNNILESVHDLFPRY